MTRTKGAKDDPSKKRKQRDFAEERRKRNAEKDAEKEKQRPAQAAKNKALLGKMKKGAPTTSSSPRRDAAPTAPNNDELLHLGQCAKQNKIALAHGALLTPLCAGTRSVSSLVVPAHPALLS